MCVIDIDLVAEIAINNALLNGLFGNIVCSVVCPLIPENVENLCVCGRVSDEFDVLRRNFGFKQEIDGG